MTVEPNQPDMVAVAQHHIDLGRKPIPIPFGKKAPSDKGWTTNEYTAADFRSKCNIGLELGYGNMMEVDADCEFARRLCEKYLPRTSMISGRPGNPCSHYWYNGESVQKRVPFEDVAPIGEKHGKMLIELRAGKGIQTVIPPSQYQYIEKDESGKSKVRYEQLTWKDGKEGVPTVVSEKALLCIVSKIAAACLMARHWQDGGRHETALALTGFLLYGGMSIDAVLDFFAMIFFCVRDGEQEDRYKAIENTIQRFENGERITGGPTLSKIVGSMVTKKLHEWLHLGEEKSDTNLSKLEASDVGNAEAVYELFGESIHYSPQAKDWLYYSGRCWEGDAEVDVTQCIVEALRKRFKEAETLDRKDIMRVSRTDDARVRGCKNQLKSLEDVSISITRFDQEPHLINTASGVVDLRTSEITPHDCSQLFTYCLNSEVGTAEDATRWIDFLQKGVDDPKHVIPYLQRALGYSITGSTKEDRLFYVQGPTRSGKSTFRTGLEGVIGQPLLNNVNYSTFSSKRESDDQGFDLAPLRPSRVVFASESNKHQRLNTAMVKQLTGGDPISCAFKFGQKFSYTPQFKLWLLSNWPINADADDDALWARVHVIKFPTSFLGREDTSYRDMMLSPTVQRGILWWLIQGAREWYQMGLQPPESVLLSAKKHRESNDSVQMWLDDRCNLAPNSWTPSSLVMGSYEGWCDANGVEKKSLKWLTDSLARRGVIGSVPKRDDEGIQRRGFAGIELIPMRPRVVKKTTREAS